MVTWRCFDVEILGLGTLGGGGIGKVRLGRGRGSAVGVMGGLGWCRITIWKLISLAPNSHIPVSTCQSNSVHFGSLRLNVNLFLVLKFCGKTKLGSGQLGV